MLPKQYRLPSSKIASVIRAGRRVSAESMQLICTPNALPISRFAFIVSKSVDKRAVARNRTRRLVRESVRLALPVVTSGWDAVLVVRRKPPDEFFAVGATVERLLRRAGLL